MALPTQQVASAGRQYAHAHLHTGTTAATALPIRARAYVVFTGAATITVTGSWGSYAAVGHPVGSAIDIEITQIQLSSATDRVLLLW